MGSVFLRGNRWWLSYSQNGKRFFESAGAGKTKTQAQALLKRRLAQLETGDHITPRDRRVTVLSLWQDFIREKEIHRQDTQNPQIRWQKRLCAVFGHLRASQVTTDLLKRYVQAQREAGYKDATINRDLADLKRAFTLGHKSTPRKVAQVPQFPMMREDNVRTGFIEDAQYEALAHHAPELWLRTLLALAYNFGWRRGELLALRVDQVNLLEKTVSIWRGKSHSKSGEPRRAHFGDLEDVNSLLRACVEGKKPTDYVLTRDGVPVRDFRKAWHNLVKAAGLGDTLFHDLRRSAVRNLIRRGVPQKTEMLISGHKTASVFDRYNIVTDDDLRDAMRKLAAGRPEKCDNSATIGEKSTLMPERAN
jgi:integrase